jgi:hypothetical protein
MGAPVTPTGALRSCGRAETSAGLQGVGRAGTPARKPGRKPANYEGWVHRARNAAADRDGMDAGMSAISLPSSSRRDDDGELSHICQESNNCPVRFLYGRSRIENVLARPCLTPASPGGCWRGSSRWRRRFGSGASGSALLSLHRRPWRTTSCPGGGVLSGGHLPTDRAMWPRGHIGGGGAAPSARSRSSH